MVEIFMFFICYVEDVKNYEDCVRLKQSGKMKRFTRCTPISHEPMNDARRSTTYVSEFDVTNRLVEKDLRLPRRSMLHIYVGSHI